ncbi:hypothetical protein [Sanguibacter suaedae]|uniref:Uncharacterized protein n=1 Tax=Sanguibacter suaedae TaxID=2795737 RepID=A0A934IF61_9MICO|nr:hypothetical protein [Sanguibacter suaedae]MBI9115824.1 hypothetical protein [Sanguibacter suaedae]
MSEIVPRFPPVPEHIGISELCHVCHRARVHAQTTIQSLARACTRCLSLDRALGAPFGARLLTPLDEGTDPGSVLHNRLWGSPGRDLAKRLRAHHHSQVDELTAQARASGLSSLQVRYPGASPIAQMIDWDAWPQEFPAGPEYTVAGYQRYVQEVHPWVDSVEPRVCDTAWLSLLAGL